LPGFCLDLGAHYYPRHEEIVNKALHCHCGFEASAQSEDGLVAEVRRHAWEAHRMALSHDDALLLAFRAELNEEAPPMVPRDRQHDPRRRNDR
jgi:predicted small metal-binding protein